MITIWKTLTLTQKIALVPLGLGVLGSASEATVAALDQDWILFASWLTVILGIGIVWVDLAAYEYFRHQERLAGRSWLIRVFTRTCITITLIFAYITAARALYLIAGPSLILPVLTGLFLVWLGIIPILMHREFEAHEGR